MNDLLKLSGMQYRGGMYSPEQWQDKTGINPRRFPAHIHITASNLCIWTPQAERLFQAHSAQVAANWNALGVA